MSPYRSLMGPAVGGNLALLGLTAMGLYLQPQWGPAAVIVPVAAGALFNGLTTWRLGRSVAYLGRLARSLADPLDYQLPALSPDLPREIVDVAADLSRLPETLAPGPAPGLGKAELLAAVNSMSEGLIIYDRHLQVVLLNPAIAQWLIPHNPAATGRLIQNPHDRIFFDRAVDQAALTRIWHAMEEEPDLPRTDFVALSKPDQVLKRHCAPLRDGGGQRIGHVVLYHDVTAEADAERLRRDFIADASHELRTPVTSIKVLVESLVDGAKDDPELLSGFCDDLLVEAERLHDLVDNLLDLSRYEAGQETLRLGPFDPESLIETVMGTVGPFARQRGVSVRLAVPPGIGAIRADRVRVSQVLINLLTNAIKFTPAEGTVTLSLRRLDDSVEWRVQDTGIGIPEGDLPFVFDRFYRVSRDRNRTHGGSGLGLTIVKRAIEAHGGRIWVESGSGGTTFTFRLPQDGEERTEPSVLAARALEGS